MALEDTKKLRETLANLLPGLCIERKVPTPSNQRLVYFCHVEIQAGDNAHSSPLQKELSEKGDLVLKVSEGVSASGIARLEKEIEILNSLQSPYYPKLFYYDVFTEDPVTEEIFHNRLFVTIEERIDGIGLNQCMSDYSNEESVCELLLELVPGLRLLWEHKQKIIHRDIKPDNILIRKDGSCVIIDLGIVREEGSAGQTMTFFDWGPCSPAYASPEQARNEKRSINFRSDFFSLATLAYELLVGKNPFLLDHKNSLEEVLARVCTHAPAPLKEIVGVSGKFSDLIERMMSKEAYMRPRTVDDLWNALKAVEETYK
jgi:serine/threonine-protein kinase